MMTEPLKQLDGFFICFSPDELSDVRQYLSDLGYSPDGEGIKNFLLDSMSEEEKPGEDSADRIIKQVSGFINSNPATVKAGLNVAAAILGKIKKAGPQATGPQRPG